MKRSPLRRGKPLERRAELRADVEKVREFLRRGKQLERRAVGRARSGMRRFTEDEGPLTPVEWRIAVHDASGGRCVMTGARARNAFDPRFQAHHAVPKRVLRQRGLLDRVWDPRNGVWLRADIHAAHERPAVRATRIPAEKLPAMLWDFCRELDALEGTAWATELVLRAHPPAGSSRALRQEDSDGGRGDGD